MSAAASSLEANSVAPSLCWDSRWPPRWTVYMLAGQAACAELHTSPSTCCLSFSHAVCCDTDLLAIIHLCLLYSFDCHLCPTKRHHILHHPCQELPSTVFVHLLQGSHLPWHPHPCCHHFCGVWLWPQPDSRRCRMPKVSLSPTKGGMMEWYPILLQCCLPFFSGASSELLSMDLFLAT